MSPSTTTAKSIIGPAAGTITTRDELDAALLAIGQAEIRLDVLNAELDARINEIKKSFETEAKPLFAEIARKAAAIQAAAEANRALWFGKKQSIKLLYGTVIFRKSKGVKYLKSEASIIDTLKVMFKKNDLWKSYIKIKESLSKTALTEIPDALHPEIGIERYASESVGYETNREEIEKVLKDRP